MDLDVHFIWIFMALAVLNQTRSEKFLTDFQPIKCSEQTVAVISPDQLALR